MILISQTLHIHKIEMITSSLFCLFHGLFDFLKNSLTSLSHYIRPLAEDKFEYFLSKSLPSSFIRNQSNSNQSIANLVIVAVQDGVGESAEETDDVETAERDSE